VRITCDRQADALYIHLTEGELPPGRSATVKAQPPAGVEASVMLDWKDDWLIGIEVLDASMRLSQDLLDGAESIGREAEFPRHFTERSRSGLPSTTNRAV
jgi:uncharacterized protein YuzE